MRATSFWIILGLFCGAFCQDRNGIVGFEESISVKNNEPITYIYRNESLGVYAYRIQVNSALATVASPVQVMAQVHSRITTWQVPLQVNRAKGILLYQNTSRILCNDGNDIINVSHPMIFSITISTHSDKPIKVNLLVTLFDEFALEPDRKYVTKFSPGEPIFYFFSFEKLDSNVKVVTVKVNSNSHKCFIVSIQDMKRPGENFDEDVRTEKYQTISNKKGLIVQRDNFKNGFMIVFTSIMYDIDCELSHDSKKLLVYQMEEVSFKVSKKNAILEYAEILYYIAITLITIAFVIIFTSWGILKYQGFLEDDFFEPPREEPYWFRFLDTG